MPVLSTSRLKIHCGHRLRPDIRFHFQNNRKLFLQIITSPAAVLLNFQLQPAGSDLFFCSIDKFRCHIVLLFQNNPQSFSLIFRKRGKSTCSGFLCLCSRRTILFFLCISSSPSAVVPASSVMLLLRSEPHTGADAPYYL